MASLLDLCNQALAEIAKASIASINEQSLEARECRRFAQPLLAEVADWSDALPIGRARVALAEIPNDRPAEWLNAYAAPMDIASPIAIRMQEAPSQHISPNGSGNFPLQDGDGIAFIFEDRKIFTNIANATLIYTRIDIGAHEFSPMLQRAYVLELAARLAGPLTGDQKIVREKMGQARLARMEAIADEENKSPRRTVRYVSDAERARMGYGL